MATNDRRVRRVLATIAIIAVVIAVVVVTRGQGRKNSVAAGDGATADPWAASAGKGADLVAPRSLTAAAAAFLRMRPAGPAVVVTGVVRLAPGGTPVAGAEVAFMNDSGENTAIADDSGRYAIKVASGIQWKVHARTEAAVGYPESFVPSSTAPVRDLEVHPTAIVRGLVTDVRGAAVPGAVVSIEVDATARGLLESALQLSTTADDAGRYQLPALPGAILVKGARGMQQGVGLATTLAPGETADIDIRVLDPITITGTVVSGDGKPVAGATILAAATISRGGPTEKQQFDSGDDGSFTGVMPAGWLRLEAKRGSERSPASARQVDTGARLDGVVLTIAEPIALHGRIVTPDGTPVDGARIRLVANAVYDGVSNRDGTFDVMAPGDQPYTVKIKHSDGSLQREVASWSGEQTFVMPGFGSLAVVAMNKPTIADLAVVIDSFLPAGEAGPRSPAEARFRGTGGQVVLTNLEPGRYDLTVSARGFASATLPRVEVGDGSRRPIAVTLAAPSTLSGVVRSGGQPVAGAQLTVNGAVAFSDGKGRWHVGDVAAGPVSIVVVKQGFGNAWVSAVAGPEAGAVEIELRPAGDGAGMVDGVGVVLSPSAHGGTVVTSVLPGSPADGKLVTGDLIEEIDGTAVGAAAVGEIVARLRGAAGSSVSIKVRRAAAGGGGTDSESVDVVRRRLVVPQGTPAIAIAVGALSRGRRC